MRLYPVYNLMDVEIVRGCGCHVYDSAGRDYLDLYGGHAVISVGHCHPHYVEALQRQAATLGFYSNSVVNGLQERLAERIGRLSGYEDYSLFLVNSGAEANENALKLASFHTGRQRVLAATAAFHGRTSLAVEATDNPRITAPVNRSGHVTRLPFNDLPAFRNELRKGDVAAVIVEPIQGVGGVRVATDEFLHGLEAACREHGAVLIADEVQCGCGRTGHYFAHQHAGVRPQLITCAKGIGGGFPIGAVLISPDFTPRAGQLGTTFGGSHLACAAALAVADIMEQEHLEANAAQTGARLLQGLSALQKQPGSHITDIRGRGLMIGIEFDRPIAALRRQLVHEQHLFTGASGQCVLRLLPPLTLTLSEADEALARIGEALAQWDKPAPY